MSETAPPPRRLYRIERLGAEGDGVGRPTDAPAEEPTYIPLTCPGDIAEAIPTRKGGVTRGMNVRLVTPSPRRAAPPCADFGRCGGCALQHTDADTYREFKEGLLTRALESAGADPLSARPLIIFGPGARRRASFKVKPDGTGGAELGFSERGAGGIVVPRDCKVLEPALATAAKETAELLKGVKPRELPQEAALCLPGDTGADALLIFDAPLSPALKKRLTERAAASGLARLTVRAGSDETVLHDTGRAFAVFGGVHVAVPPGGFLQASRACAAALTVMALRTTEAFSAAADLFCGSGAYSLPLLAAGKRVLAAEGERTAAAALFNAARREGFEAKLSLHTRDLEKAPVTARELQAYPAVVVNPPRTGGKAQTRQIAESEVRAVAMISCSAQAFTADARRLLESGFTLNHAVPLDQFIWTPHTEIFAEFRR